VHRLLLFFAPLDFMAGLSGLSLGL